MELKEGYKKTEFGVIPLEWEYFKVDDLLDEISMGPFGSDIKVSNFISSGVPVLNGSNVISEKLIDLFKNYVTEEKAKSLKKAVAKRGNIVITHRGSLGQIAYIPENSQYEKYVISQSQFRVSFNKQKVDPHYFVSYFHSRKGQTMLLEGKGHTGVPAIAQPTTTFRKLFVPLPPLPEQQAIATALSDINSLISSLTKLIDKKKKIKQGAMQELITGGKRLDGFSGEWEVRALGDLFDFNGGHSASREQLSLEGYCYLHYGDIHGSNKTYIDVDNEYMEIPKLYISLSKISKVKLLEDGDVVFVDASEDDEGTSRHVVVKNPNNIPYISGLHTIVSKSKNDLLDKEFRQYCFQSSEIKSQFKFYAVGTKVSGISRNAIAKINLRFPSSKEEQAAIAKILSNMDSEIDQLEVKLNKYKVIKQGMMQELLTGRIRLLGEVL